MPWTGSAESIGFPSMRRFASEARAIRMPRISRRLFSPRYFIRTNWRWPAQRAVDSWGGVSGVRAALGAATWLGVSAHDERELAEAEAADYATLSPVFETSCKPGIRPLGAATARAWSARSPVPVLWLGGIDPRTAPMAWAAGAAGVAVRGAAMAAGGSLAAIRRPVISRASDRDRQTVTVRI